MASLYTWSDAYSVRVNIVDQQHKKLFALINDLHEAMKCGQANTLMAPILTGLLDYTKTHFRDEETLLTKVRYPGLSEHKGIHEGFIKKVADLQSKFAKGSLSLSVETLQFLGDWIKNHILKTDMQYSRFLAEQNFIK